MFFYMYMFDDNKPIGWWLKEVDRLLEQSFAAALAVEGVDRRQWQLLNAVAAEGSTAALAPFLPERADRDRATAARVERGWVERRGDALALTVDGASLRSRLTALVGAQRRRTTEGISDAEYVATVDVLRRMAGNLATR
jgi:DNA-binding MarR family transcriptional regulator